MKKTILSICFACIAICLPYQAIAQKNENANHEDSYYLKGAVPEVNGKVVFSKEFSISGMSKGEVYEKVHTWMDARMKQNANKSRVAYVNEANGQIAANAEEYIVFSNTALALDRTKVMYQMIADCDNGKCTLQIKNIRYDYPNEKEIYIAEEWISDEVALSKDQSKLVRGYAKWRRKTVDFVDDMNESLQKALSGINTMRVDDGKPEETRKGDEVAVVNAQPIQATPPTQPVVKAAAPAINPAIPVAAVETTAKEEETVKPTETVKPEEAVTPVETPIVAEAEKPAVPTEAFPELTADIIQASKGRLVIIIGEDEFNRTTMTANAGGYLSSKDGKKFINTILTPEQNYQVLEQAEAYTVSFYPNGASQPSVVMKCRNATTEKPGPGRANIFMGEVTCVETH